MGNYTTSQFKAYHKFPTIQKKKTTQKHTNHTSEPRIKRIHTNKSQTEKMKKRKKKK